MTSIGPIDQSGPMAKPISSAVWAATRGLLALFGIPFAALMVVSVVVGSPDDNQDCRLCDVAMGIALFGGLFVGLVVAERVWRRRVRPDEVAADVLIRNEALRGQAFTAALFCGVGAVGSVIGGVVASDLWILGLAFLLAGFTAWASRAASTVVCARGNELVIRNLTRTRRLERADLQLIDIGQLDPTKQRGRATPFVETRSGERIPLIAANQRGIGTSLNREVANDAVGRLRRWHEQGSPAS